MASDSRASSASRVSDQTTLENAVIPSVQFGPALPVPYCGYDEYPHDEYTTIRISVEHDSCWFLNPDGSVAYEIHKVTYRFTMFGMEMKLVIGALIDRGANACLTVQINVFSVPTTVGSTSAASRTTTSMDFPFVIVAVKL